MTKLILYLILVCSLFGCTKEELEIIGKTEEFTISSSIIGDEYPISVYLPPNYDPNKLNRLIIGLDGEFRFKEIANILSDKSQDGTLPPAVFIAIGNSAERNRDYTPTEFKKGKGKAEDFYAFIKDELIPEVESRYTIDASNNKTLLGNSFGGLFVYALRNVSK